MLEGHISMSEDLQFISLFYGYENLWVVLNTTRTLARELRTAPMAERRCAATTAACRPLKLSSPGSAGPTESFQCSWQQAVVLKGLNTSVFPASRDCLEWSWLEIS